MKKYASMAYYVVPSVCKHSNKIRKYSKKPDNYPLTKRYQTFHKMMKNIVKKPFKVDIRCFGVENLPKEQVIFTPNHIDNMDPILLVAQFERNIFFVGKKEIEKFFVVGDIMKALGSYFLDRESLRDGVKMINYCTNLLKTDPTSNLVIFPEGTRTKDKVNFLPNEFKSGTYKIAKNTKLPIVPIVIFGSQYVLDQKITKKRYQCVLNFLKPLYYDDYKDMSTEAIAKSVYQMVLANLDKTKEYYNFYDNLVNKK